MSRDTVAAVTSAASLPQVRYRLLVDVNSLASGTVRACTGGNFIPVGANTYVPVGKLGGIDAVQEDSDPFPRSVRLWFAAVDSSQVVDMVNENLFNKPVSIYRAFVDDQITLVGTPQLLWRGRTNTVNMQTNDPERGNYYEIECESRLKRVSRAQYFDKHTLQVVMSHSGDTFFDYVPLIPLRRAPWGQLPYSVGGITGVGQPGGNKGYDPGYGPSHPSPPGTPPGTSPGNPGNPFNPGGGQPGDSRPGNPFNPGG